MQTDVNSIERAAPRDPMAGGFVLTNPEAEPHVPQSVGELLSAGREQAGLSIAEVANRLRMSVKQIGALERGDYTAIPSGTFLRGFVRNYAKAVGVDIETALKVLERTHTDGLAVAASPVVALATFAEPVAFQARGEDLATPKSRAIIAVLLVACLAAVVWYWWEFVRPHLADGGRPPEKQVLVQPVVMPALPMANAALGSASDSTVAQERPPVAGATVVGVASGNSTNAGRANNARPVELAGATPAPLLPNTSPAATAANEKDTKTKRAGETGVIGFTFSGESWV
jgi:cytoskeleton protein RodZ